MQLVFALASLRRLHAAVFDTSAQSANSANISVGMVLPALRKRTLHGCVICLTGLTSSEGAANLASHPVGWWCLQVGAKVSSELDERTTHLVAVRQDTAKWHQARNSRLKLHVVHPGWVLRAIVTLERPPEHLFAIPDAGDWPSFVDVWAIGDQAPRPLDDMVDADRAAVQQALASAERKAKLGATQDALDPPNNHNALSGIADSVPECDDGFGDEFDLELEDQLLLDLERDGEEPGESQSGELATSVAVPAKAGQMVAASGSSCNVDSSLVMPEFPDDGDSLEADLMRDLEQDQGTVAAETRLYRGTVVAEASVCTEAGDDSDLEDLRELRGLLQQPAVGTEDSRVSLPDSKHCGRGPDGEPPKADVQATQAGPQALEATVVTRGSKRPIEVSNGFNRSCKIGLADSEDEEQLMLDLAGELCQEELFD